MNCQPKSPRESNDTSTARTSPERIGAASYESEVQPQLLVTETITTGRELRVIVGADKLTDLESESLSHDIAKKIQDEMTYPGQVKITVIRETRAVSYAK